MSAHAHQDGRAAGLSGIEFGAAFHRDAVRPLLSRELPGLRYAAARLGSGSDVLGLDDVMSRDHDWGSRLTLLVDGAAQAAVPVLRDLLARRLPDRFHGRPVRFAATWDAAVSHKVEVATVGDFAASRLGVNPLAGLSGPDWLVLTGQSVLEVIAAPVYADSTAELAVLRRELACGRLPLPIEAQQLEDLAGTVGRDPDHRPHRVRQGDARHVERDRGRVRQPGELPVELRAQVESDPDRLRPDRGPPGRARIGFGTPGRGGRHLRFPLFPLRGHVRTEQSGAHRSMRSRATWRHTSRPVPGIGMPKLWA